jgi:hypothetical protein
MIDGVPIGNVAATDGSLDFGNLSAIDIDRIEIVRGPQSSQRDREGRAIAAPPSGQPRRIREREGPSLLTPTSPRSGLRRLIGHPAMAGAVGAAVRGSESAVSEIPAHRIAERPSADELVDFLQPHPAHLPNLGFGKGPRRPPLRHKGESGAELCSAGAGWWAISANRTWRITARVSPGVVSAPAAVELDPDPIRLADHGAAGRPAERRGDDARASSLERQLLEDLDRLFCPHHLLNPQRLPAAAFGSRKMEWSQQPLFRSRTLSRTLEPPKLDLGR